MEIYYEIKDLLFWGSILFVISLLLQLVQKSFDFFVLKNENVRFTINLNEKIILWVSLSLILNKIL
jgi:hypothetical protein